MVARGRQLSQCAGNGRLSALGRRAQFVDYFWSIIAVDRQFRRVLPNALNRFLLNKESGVVNNPDGSLTLCFGPEKPADIPDPNWLPTGAGKPWSLTFRFYGPRGGVADGSYYPPPLVKR